MNIMLDRLWRQIAQIPDIMLIIGIIFLLLLLLQIVLFVRLHHLQKKYKQLLGGLIEGKPMEEMLLTYFRNVQNALRQVGQLEIDVSEMGKKVKLCVQKVGIVRFNAFPDTGSDLSFAVALLDEGGNGVVFSSLYGRNESRIYAKPIRNAVSTYHLTDEEKAAIEQALGKK
ncbi:MAG: DUF4446 family protein [bacterium]|jgi:hypothetical protein